MRISMYKCMNVVVPKKQNKNHFSDCIIEDTGY